MQTLICPCCGFDFEYSEYFRNKVLACVSEFYNVPIADMVSKKDNSKQKHNRARCISIYFLKSMSNVKFKEINPFFGWSPDCAMAGNKYAQVVHMIETHPEYESEVFEIRERLLKKLNPKKIF